MRTRMVEVREGEDLGPVDWSHPTIVKMEREARKCSSAPGEPLLLAVLRLAEADPKGWRFTTDGGIPRCGFHEVLAVRMYDGHPFWKPTPSVLLRSWLGAHWEPFSMLSDATNDPRAGTFGGK